MPFGVGPLEIVIVLVLALLVLGPKRLPDTARSLGRGMREFKGAITGDGKERIADDDALKSERAT